MRVGMSQCLNGGWTNHQGTSAAFPFLQQFIYSMDARNARFPSRRVCTLVCIVFVSFQRKHFQEIKINFQSNIVIDVLLCMCSSYLSFLCLLALCSPPHPFSPLVDNLSDICDERYRTEHDIRTSDIGINTVEWCPTFCCRLG
jgi:hypothetical protein